MQKWEKIAGLIIFAGIVVYFLGLGVNWWEPYWETAYSKWTTAKEAYSIASSYALAGEPDAQLTQIIRKGRWNDAGKSDSWAFEFYAPDGRRMYVYVDGKEIRSGDEDPSERWRRGSVPGYVPQFVGEWVDSPVFMEDSIIRAKKALDDSYVKMYMTFLEFNSDMDSVVWEVRFRSGTSGANYFYNATDGSFIRGESVSLIIID